MCGLGLFQFMMYSEGLSLSYIYIIVLYLQLPFSLEPSINDKLKYVSLYTFKKNKLLTGNLISH